MQVTDEDREYKIDCVEDKPARGMWHCGSNPVWVTVTHVPTMMSVRAYSHQQHKALSKAKEHLSQMVNDAGDKKCSYPAALAGQWQDISTAPKDASFILVGCTKYGDVDQAHWDVFNKYWRATGGKCKGGNFLGYDPDIWRPMPTPPKVKEK